MVLKLLFNSILNSFSIHFVLDDFKKELKNMFETTKRMWADIKIQQQDVIKRLESLEKRTSSLSSGDLDLIKTFLPLKTVEKVDEFNKNLKNKEYELIFVSIPLEADIGDRGN